MNQFTWGIWMTNGTPYGGKASATMEEDRFRKLLSALLPVVNWDTDRALDRLKEIMTAEMNSLVTNKRGANHG